MSKLRITNSSGVTGVHWDLTRFIWKTKTSYLGKSIYLGSFKDFSDAKAVRKGAEKALLTFKILKPLSIQVIGVSTLEIILSAIIPETTQEHQIKLVSIRIHTSEPGAKDCGCAL